MSSEKGLPQLIINKATQTTFDNLEEKEPEQIYVIDPEYEGNKAVVSTANGNLVESTVTNTELGYLSGVTSNIQTQLGNKQDEITGGASTITSDNLTASRALVSDASGKVAVSAVTSTELGYLDGVTSAIQTQLNGKATSTQGQKADSALQPYDCVDNLTSTASNLPLSAKQGKELATQISNLQSLGRFCAIWNAATGLPTSEPTTSPYIYHVGDYFRIGTAGYRVPKGTQYVQGAYDTVTEQTVIGDVWYFDGTSWHKQASSGGGTVQDVQINGTSILSGGTANIPMASGTQATAGVVWTTMSQGLQVATSGNAKGRIEVYAAQENHIIAKTQNYTPLVPAKLDIAIREGLGNNSLTWSDAYKTSARATIGAGTSNVKIDLTDWD